MPAPAAASTGAAATAPPAELELRADQQIYDAERRRFLSTGNVSALLAGGRLLADRLEIDSDTRTIYAYGQVRFQRGSQYLQASRLRYSLLEANGELQDVYGVLDLDGAAVDLDLGQQPTAALPQPEALSCPPLLPPPPQWHPYPWAVSAWMGQMVAASFGDTFAFRGRLRPEYLAGIGLQRRLLDAGPLALELDANLLGHRAASQPGGPFNQAIPYANTPGQTFTELTLGLGVRLWLQPWLNVSVVEGISLLSQNSNYERSFRKNYSQLLNHLGFELEALVSPRWSAVGRINNRSGAYGVYNGVEEGSNTYLLGLRYRWGDSTPLRPSLQLPPAVGCPGAPAEPLAPVTLAEQLQAVALGLPAAPRPVAATAAAAPLPTQGNPWTLARQQEQRRREAIARLDQRVRDVRQRQGLVLEQRLGLSALPTATDAADRFGGIQPDQLADLNSQTSRQLVRGTISRWRIQARLVRLTPTGFRADRIAFTNDPFTPAQVWLDSRNVVATLRPNGDTVLWAERNRLRLEDRLPLALPPRIKIRKENADTRLALSYDQKDRDGVFVGYNIPVGIGSRFRLNLQPQFMLQRAINGSSNAYPLPGQPPLAAPVSRPNRSTDLFGLQAMLNGPIAGFNANAQLELSSLNPDQIPTGTRSWGDLVRPLKLPWLGESNWRFFGAYRYRIWNGTLGEQEVYSAYGTSLDASGVLPTWGRLSGNYYWRIGVGNYRTNPVGSDSLTDLWRAGAVASFNFSLPLWRGATAPATASQGLLYSPEPITPGLTLHANVLGTMTYYGDGTNQNTVSLSAGPTLTLGNFVRPFLDYTSLTITGSVTLRRGLSPFGFDQAVDLGALGIGLTQQIAGPLVFSGGVGFNVDPRSPNFGDVTGSYLELRWQRRAYEVGVFYSPYQGIGGIRLKLNDFSFQGPGRPFVPYNPVTTILDRPF
ncbi:MAG: DUF3769 domain-containing protein [Synechococcus sp.]|nr:DUF3769 domain-containing protein [Synechococcus sp.]